MYRRQCALNTFCVYCFRLECPIEESSPQEDRKFIVFESWLKKLFTSCPRCYAPCRSFSVTRGTLLQGQTICANGHCLVLAKPAIGTRKASRQPAHFCSYLDCRRQSDSHHQDVQVHQGLHHLGLNVFQLPARLPGTSHKHGKQICYKIVCRC